MNSTFQSMLTERGIKFYTSENEDIKAAVVERFNRTLKFLSVADFSEDTVLAVY